MSIIRSPLFQFALLFVSFHTLSEFAHARLEFLATPESSSHPEEVELKTRIAREWNERISSEFWDVVRQAQSKTDVGQETRSLPQLERTLTQLQFDFHAQHLAALESRVDPPRSSITWDDLPNQPLFAHMGHQNQSILVAQSLSGESLEGMQSQAQHGVVSLPHDSELNLSAVDHSSSVLDVEVQRDPTQRVFIEAFDRLGSRIQGVDTQFLTAELAGTDYRGWEVATSFNHLPTVNWVDPQGPVSHTPLIGLNTIALLESRFGIHSESSAGIVFGRVQAGWKVELSDRAERPIFLDDSGLLSDQDNVAVDRNFIFLNSAPGVQMVFFESTLGRGMGSVAVPVLTGAASYVDLTHIQWTTLSGKITEKTDDLSTIATFRVVGQSAAVAGVRVGENFRLDSVVVAHPYPLFVETDRADGYTQRYRLLSDQLQNLDFTRFSRERIEKWKVQIAHLQNGLSPESGMLVAAFPRLVEHYQQDTDLKVRIRALTESSHLNPSVYVRAPNGALNADHFLAPHEDFVIGAQISEGPFILEVLNHAQNVIYSELGFSSPGVLNVFNPR